MFHRVSFSRVGCRSLGVQPKSCPVNCNLSGNRDPAGEYLPPSTHRLFLFFGLHESSKKFRRLMQRVALIYTEGRVIGSMRLLIGLAFAVTIPLVVTLGYQQDSAPRAPVNPTQPVVSITPRAKPPAADPNESITDRRSDIRVDTTLVLIPVSVTDPMSRFVTGLDKENFKLSEDKVDQEITQFSSEDAPLSVGIVFDSSGSMGAKLQRSRQAVVQFMKTANPQDEFFLVVFSDRPELVQSFTTETEEVQNRLTFTQAKGRTALLDGVYLAMNQMKKAHNPRKAIPDHFRRRR